MFTKMTDEEVFQSFNVNSQNSTEDDADDIFDEVPEIFKVEPEDFDGDETAYTKAIIRHVRKTHSIDDRLENARKESISKNYTTHTEWPSCLREKFQVNG